MANVKRLSSARDERRQVRQGSMSIDLTLAADTKAEDRLYTPCAESFLILTSFYCLRFCAFHATPFAFVSH